MFTFSLLYVFLYLLVFLSLLILAFTHLPVYVLTHLSITNFVIFLQKYSPTKNLFLFVIFALTGLPPVGLFFVKFNIFVFLLYQTHIFVVCIVFLMFFFNMVYYVQIFNFKNFKKPVYHILTPNIVKAWQVNNSYVSVVPSYNSYRLTLTVINTLVFLLLTIITFSDYFLIISIL